MYNNNRFSYHNQSYFFGLTMDNETNHQWLFLDGQYLEYSAWDSCPQRNMSEQCALTRYTGDAHHWRWHAVHCDVPRPSVCQVSLGHVNAFFTAVWNDLLNQSKDA